MEKLKLSLENLVVETFAPTAEQSASGTVRANQSGPYTDECQSCGAESACGGVCPNTPGCPPGSQTCTCEGFYTCPGVYTCGGVDTCVWPDCTAYGAIC
jgi:hypothetical protein